MRKYLVLEDDTRESLLRAVNNNDNWKRCDEILREMKSHGWDVGKDVFIHWLAPDLAGEKQWHVYFVKSRKSYPLRARTLDHERIERMAELMDAFFPGLVGNDIRAQVAAVGVEAARAYIERLRLTRVRTGKFPADATLRKMQISEFKADAALVAAKSETEGNNMHIGAKIARKRREGRLSQRRVAGVFNRTGAWLCSIEAGNVAITEEDATKILRVIGTLTRLRDEHLKAVRQLSREVGLPTRTIQDATL